MSSRSRWAILSFILGIKRCPTQHTPHFGQALVSLSGFDGVDALV
jgi:hypothetical protein